MAEDCACCESDRKLSRRALLLGLLANRLFGFRQAVPVVGLFIGACLVREGVEILKEGKLCSC